MQFDRFLTIFSMTSLKHHIKYQCWNQLDILVVWPSKCHCKEPKLGQNEDSLVGWFCQLADDFLFVMNVLWLLLSLKVGHTAPPHIVSTSAEFGSSQAILAPVSLWTHSWQVMANLVSMKGFKILQHSNNIWFSYLSCNAGMPKVADMSRLLLSLPSSTDFVGTLK